MLREEDVEYVLRSHRPLPALLVPDFVGELAMREGPQSIFIERCEDYTDRSKYIVHTSEKKLSRPDYYDFVCSRDLGRFVQSTFKDNDLLDMMRVLFDKAIIVGEACLSRQAKNVKTYKIHVKLPSFG